jgi:hypothetical protein
MVILPWCVLKVNVMIVGYALPWIFEFHLDMVEFRVTTHEYIEKLPSSRFPTSISIGCYSIIVRC